MPALVIFQLIGVPENELSIVRKYAKRNAVFGFGYPSDEEQVTLRRVRILQDHLLRTEAWEVAGHAYAEKQHRNFRVIHTLKDWCRSMFLKTGPEADARRASVALDCSRWGTPA